MKKNILVTGTGGRSVGSGILHALTRSNRSISEYWNIIAADADSFAWGLYKTESSVLLPFVTDPKYLAKLQQIIKEYDIHAIVPGTEGETEFLAKNAAELGGIAVICNRSKLMPLMMDKNKMVESFKKKGIKYIPTKNILEFKSVSNEWEFPYIVKPMVGTGGSRGLKLVTDEEEIIDCIKELGNLAENYCIQPYIGSGTNEYTVGVLSNKHGEIIDSIVLKRKLVGLSLLSSKKIGKETYQISSGYSQGFIIKHKEIQEFCENLATTYNSRGPLNIQLREHKGEFYVFDFHPRFSGTTPIRADAGFHEVDILLKNFLMDQKFTRLDYKYDVAAIRAFEHVLVPINDMLT